MCGSLKYTIKYDTDPDEVDVTDSTGPMSYEEGGDDKKITVDTDDVTLIDTTVPYKIIIELENYPKITNPEAP